MKNDKFLKSLELAFRLKRQRAQELAGHKEQSLARVRAGIRKRIISGDLPEDLEIDCPMVRPFLPQLADPLEMTTAPNWLEEHLMICGNCRRQLEHLEELHQVITVSEMPPTQRQDIVDTPAGFLKKVCELEAIPPDKITCQMAETYYRDMAGCDLDVPAEIYRHAKNCSSCRGQVSKLRHDMCVSIPQIGTPEFERLLGEKIELDLGLSAQKVGPRQTSRVGVFVRRNWSKVAAASIAAVLVIGFLIFSTSPAMAVTFEQVCLAFAKIQFIHITVQPQGSQFIQVSTPASQTWYSRKPLVQITRDRDGTYSRFSPDDGTFVRYDRTGKLIFSRHYPPEDLAKQIKLIEEALDFRSNLGLTKDVKFNWSLLQQNVVIDGKSTDIYELTTGIAGPQDSEQKKFRVYVDKATDLPIQKEVYRTQEQTGSWVLRRTEKFAYPSQIPEEVLNPTFSPDP